MMGIFLGENQLLHNRQKISKKNEQVNLGVHIYIF